MDANRVGRSRRSTSGRLSMEKNFKLPTSHLSVNEKVIFCIDMMALCQHVNEQPLIADISEMLTMYIQLKIDISVNPVEFLGLFIVNGNDITEIEFDENVNTSTLLATLSEKTQNSHQENGELDLSVLFSMVAEKVILPDPKVCGESRPPPWVYHCIFLIGRNIFLPIMKETNAFDYLTQSPYFVLDTVYVYNASLENNNCEDIATSLYSMYESLNGYYFPLSSHKISKLSDIFSQMLGHPLIRQPQNRARYSINEIFPLECRT